MDKIIFDTLESMNQFGEKIGKLVEPGMVITLSGDLAAGKTTFSKAVGVGLGIKEVINSPTYTIVKVYQGRLPLYHFDAYRLEDQDVDLGFEELIEGVGLCLIEWPMFMESLIPDTRLEINIHVENEVRQFTLNPIGEKYVQLCKELNI